MTEPTREEMNAYRLYVRLIEACGPAPYVSFDEWREGASEVDEDSSDRG